MFKLYLYFHSSVFCFGEAVTLKNMSNDLIDQLESFVRLELQAVFKSWETAEFYQRDFYGSYHLNQEKFKVSAGERVLILELKKYIEEVIKRDNIKYFSADYNQKTQPKRKQLDFTGTVEIPNVVRFFTHQKSFTCDDQQQQNGTDKNNTELQKQLHSNVINMLTSNGAEESLNRFDIDRIVISQKDNNTHGVVSCAICPDASQKQISVACKIVNGNLFWTLSNFQRHLTNVHMLQPGHMPHGESIKIHSEKAVVVDKRESIENSPNAINADKLDVEMGEMAILMTASENGDDGNEITIQTLEIDSLESITEKILEQIKTQTMEMLRICSENSETTAEMSFEIGDNTYGVRIAEIEADGNCLFDALTHQLFGHQLGSEAHKTSVFELRTNVGFYWQKVEFFRARAKGVHLP